jgi:hypothetical protein
MAALRLSGLAALAAHGQDPGAPELLQQALDQRFRREVLPCLLNLGRGGGWFGGEPAGAKAGLDLLEFTAAAKSAMDLDLIQDAPWFKDRLALLSACVLPGVKYTPRGGFNQTASFGDPVVPEEEAADLIRLQMQILLALRPGDQAAGLARALVGGRRGAKLLAPHLVALEMLWQGEEAGAEALAFAPLTHVAPAVGLAFSRSDWSPLATWLAFSCGPHYSEHQHLDAGAIYFGGKDSFCPMPEPMMARLLLTASTTRFAAWPTTQCLSTIPRNTPAGPAPRSQTQGDLFQRRRPALLELVR